MPALQWFPLDMAATPLTPVGALDGPIPTTAAYTHRDYGNRVGIFRVMAVLDRLGLPRDGGRQRGRRRALPGAARRDRRAALGGRRPRLHMGRIHHGGLDRGGRGRDSSTRRSDVLRQASGQPVRGWLSPGGGESPHTLDLLAERGVGYVLDWVNDELPYRAPHGERPAPRAAARATT